jgi:hypothetical protein
MAGSSKKKKFIGARALAVMIVPLLSSRAPLMGRGAKLAELSLTRSSGAISRSFYEAERDWWSPPTKLGVPKIFNLYNDPKEQFPGTLTPNVGRRSHDEDRFRV